MRDVIITAQTDGYSIDNPNNILGISGENLQGKIIFKPEPFIDGVCRMHIADEGSIEMKKENNCYTLPIKSSLLKESFNFCIKITENETEEGIPKFSTRILKMQVLETIEDNTEIPDQYPTWIETFDSKIAEMQKLEETITANEEDRKKAEDERNETLQETVDKILDMTEEYNANAKQKTIEFDDNAKNKEEELNAIADTARDFVSAVTFAKAETDPKDGHLYFIAEESLGTMGFEIDYKTGHLTY
jgi:hypothetical protein